jgi:hypothetical protein
VTRRQCLEVLAVAGATNINDWASRTSPLSRSSGRAEPAFLSGLALKGATLSRAKDMADEDGWVGLTWNHPLMYEQNFAPRGSIARVFQIGRCGRRRS